MGNWNQMSLPPPPAPPVYNVEEQIKKEGNNIFYYVEILIISFQAAFILHPDFLKWIKW